MSRLLNSGTIGSGGTDEEILETWKNSGLILNLNENNALILAKVLDRCANKLLHSNTKYGERLDTVIFPIINRIGSKIFEFNELDRDEEYANLDWVIEEKERNEMIVELLDVDFIIERVDEVLEDTISIFERLARDRFVDEEAEACAMISNSLFFMILGEFRDKKLKRSDDGDIIISD